MWCRSLSLMFLTSRKHAFDKTFYCGLNVLQLNETGIFPISINLLHVRSKIFVLTLKEGRSRQIFAEFPFPFHTCCTRIKGISLEWSPRVQEL